MSERFEPYSIVIPASDISGIDTSDPGFWHHHTHSKEDYMELASHLPEVQERMSTGQTFEDLSEDPVVGETVRAYYAPSRMASVEKNEDGSYSFGSDGRHRIAAAQELGYDVPVKVTWDYGMEEQLEGDSYDHLWDEEEEHHNPAFHEEGEFHSMPEEWQGYGSDDSEQYQSEPEYYSNVSDLENESEVTFGNNADEQHDNSYDNLWNKEPEQNTGTGIGEEGESGATPTEWQGYESADSGQSQSEPQYDNSVSALEYELADTVDNGYQY